MPAGLDGNPTPVVTAARTQVIASVARDVLAGASGARVLVGVDGASGTGKSTFADELAGALGASGRAVLRASIDSFHRPRRERYRRGAGSPEGYYLDSHDLPGLGRELLDPFAAGASAVRRAIFDEPGDRPVEAPAEPVPAEAFLVFDGLFLHRPELGDRWHYSVFLVADGRREAAWRAYLEDGLPADPRERDAERARRIERARRHRYMEGQAIYEREADPRRRASVVIDNDDLRRPRVLARQS